MGFMNLRIHYLMTLLALLVLGLMIVVKKPEVHSHEYEMNQKVDRVISEN